MMFSRRPTYSERASSSTSDLLSEGIAVNSKLSRLLTAGNLASLIRRPMADDTPRFLFRPWRICIARADWKTYPRARCTTRYPLGQESQQEVVDSCCGGNNDLEVQFRTGVAGMTPLDV